MIGQLKFGFMGTPDRAVIVLDQLKDQGLLPEVVITAPDKKVGRKQILQSPDVAVWAKENNINDIFQPASKGELEDLTTFEVIQNLDFIIVVAYGYIIPQVFLDAIGGKVINVHYSLLPEFRGASPVVQQILQGHEEVGYTIMRMIYKLDAGPILYQESFPMPDPLLTTGELALMMSEKAGKILPHVINDWFSGKITEESQDSGLTSYCSKITKDEALISFEDSDWTNRRKIQAYQPWPKAFFIVQKKDKSIRVKILEARYEDGALIIDKMVPAGYKPMTWSELTNWLGKDPRNTN